MLSVARVKKNEGKMKDVQRGRKKKEGGRVKQKKKKKKKDSLLPLLSSRTAEARHTMESVVQGERGEKG